MPHENIKTGLDHAVKVLIIIIFRVSLLILVLIPHISRDIHPGALVGFQVREKQVAKINIFIPPAFR
jgi:hypothetical protein